MFSILRIYPENLSWEFIYLTETVITRFHFLVPITHKWLNISATQMKVSDFKIFCVCGMGMLRVVFNQFTSGLL